MKKQHINSSPATSNYTGFISYALILLTSLLAILSVSVGAWNPRNIAHTVSRRIQPPNLLCFFF